MAFSVGPGIQLGGGIVLGAPNLGPPGIGTVITTSTTSSYTTYAVTVPFTAPCANVVCSPISYYVANSVPPGQYTTGTTSPLTVSNLIYGQPYTFTVSAVNANGIGAPSVTSNQTPGYGTLWSWGFNNNYQLGLGSVAGTNNYSNPTQYGATTTWTTASTNMWYTTSWIQSNGTLWSWGNNNYGQGGFGNTNRYSSPKQVGALTNWLSVSGAYGVVALKTDGSLWTWGYNGNYQLATGNTTSYSSPKQISTGTTWKSVSASDNTTSHTMGVRTDGTLWGWGSNNYGQLGTNNTTVYSLPKQIGALNNWLAVTAGYQFTLAVKTDGTLWTWGRQDRGYGVLGINNTSNYSSPKQVGFPSALTNWTSKLYTANNIVAAAIKNDGTLWTWGYNGYGQLGSNNTNNYNSPKQVGALTTWRQLALSTSDPSHMLGITQDGKLFGWGYNGYGQLGSNNTSNYSSPKQIGSNSNWHSIGAGFNSSFGVQTTNVFPPNPPTNLVATPYNLNTMVVTMNSPSVTATPQNWTVTSQPSGISQTGQSLSYLYQNLPYNTAGYIFTATTTNLVGTSAVSTGSAVVTGTQYLSMWGYNGYGQIGTNNTTQYYSPKNVGSYSGWTSWWCGSRTYVAGAVKSDGTLWMWGQNPNGQLGTNTINSYSSPIQIGSNSNWASISCDTHVLATDTSGRLWAWGLGTSGQLGLGDTLSRSSPTQVGSLTNWAYVHVGTITSWGVKTNGTLWGWGVGGGYYLIGNGGNSSYSSPVQVGALTNWLNVTAGSYAVFAQKTDGTAWQWGWAGNGTYTYYGVWNNTSSGTLTSPVQVTSPRSTWRSSTISKNGLTYQTIHGVGTDGTLWASGNYGTYGMFGNNNAVGTSYTSYTQIGALTNWWWVHSSDQHVLAMKTDGTIWAWGYGGNGQLGKGTSNSYSSPVQIGSLSNWTIPALAYGQATNAVQGPVAGVNMSMVAHR